MLNHIANSQTKNKVHEFLRSIKLEKQSEKILSYIPQKLYKYNGLGSWFKDAHGLIKSYFLEDTLQNCFTITNPILFNDLYDSCLHRNTLPHELEKRHN